MQPDFNTMTRGELRAYIAAHPDDRTAFYNLVDRFTTDESSEIYDLPNSSEEIEQVAFLIRQKLGQIQIN